MADNKGPYASDEAFIKILADVIASRPMGESPFRQFLATLAIQEKRVAPLTSNTIDPMILARIAAEWGDRIGKRAGAHHSGSSVLEANATPAEEAAYFEVARVPPASEVRFARKGIYSALAGMVGGSLLLWNANSHRMAGSELLDAAKAIPPYMTKGVSTWTMPKDSGPNAQEPTVNPAVVQALTRLAKHQVAMTEEAGYGGILLGFSGLTATSFLKRLMELRERKKRNEKNLPQKIQAIFTEADICIGRAIKEHGAGMTR